MRNKLMILLILISFSVSAQKSIFWLNKPSTHLVNWVGGNSSGFGYSYNGTYFTINSSFGDINNTDWNGIHWIRSHNSLYPTISTERSIDGINWTSTGISNLSQQTVFWDHINKKWIVFGKDESLSNDSTLVCKSYQSVDGINWIGKEQYGIAPPKKLITIGSRTIGLLENSIITSNNGEDWHLYPFYTRNSSKSVYPSLSLQDIYWNGSICIICGYYYNQTAGDIRGVIFTSPDGVHYTSVVDEGSGIFRYFSSIYEYSGYTYIGGEITDNYYNNYSIKTTNFTSWTLVYNISDGEPGNGDIVYNGTDNNQDKTLYERPPAYPVVTNLNAYTSMRSRRVKSTPQIEISCPIVGIQINEISANYLRFSVWYDNDGGMDAIQKGLCWSESPNPTTTDPHTEEGAFSDNFQAYARGLKAGTNYYFRFYSINSNCVSYSDDYSVQTYASSIPSVATRDISSIETTSASFEGSILATGGASITDRGFCVSTSPNPDISNTHVSVGAGGLGIFSGTITGLATNTKYYVRAYGYNGQYGYGSQLEFMTGGTLCAIPSFQNISVSGVTSVSADFNATILSVGGCSPTGLGFYYSSTNPNPTATDNIAYASATDNEMTSTAYGLTPNTQYWVKAYLQNDAGIGYSNVTTFNTGTDIGLPVVQTVSVTNIAANSASVNGTIISDGGVPITARGVQYSLYSNFSIIAGTVSAGSGSGNFTANLIGLNCGVVYYNRTYATNSVGTVYGNTVSFTTQPSILASGSINFPSYPINPIQVTIGFTNYGCDLIEQGVVWSTSPNPTTSDNKHIYSSTDEGSHTESWTMTPGTYYFSGYAINNVGTAYCPYEYPLTIPAETTIPTLTTISVVPLSTSAVSGGNISSDGGGSITQKGVQWSLYSDFSTISGSTSDGTGSSYYLSSIIGILPNTQYYCRAYATNSAGTGYGDVLEFTTTCPQMGDSYQGGIVVRIYEYGDDGYVAGECHGIIKSIELPYPTNGYLNMSWADAMYTCEQSTYGGYSDWVAPSNLETPFIQVLRNAHPELFNYPNGAYWSGTDAGGDFSWAYNLYTSTRFTDDDDNLLKVIAIRYF